MPRLFKNGTNKERISNVTVRARKVLALKDSRSAHSAGSSQNVIFVLRGQFRKYHDRKVGGRRTYSGLIVQNAAKTPITAPLAPSELEYRTFRNTILDKLATLPITPLEMYRARKSPLPICSCRLVPIKYKRSIFVPRWAQL